MPNTRISDWFHQYSNDLYQFLIYYIGSSDVEDLVQEVFIRAIKNMDSFEEKSSPKTWLFSIARHIAIDEIRRKQRLKIKNLILMGNQESHQSKSPESFLKLSETNKDLYDAIQQLKKNYRDVIILRGIKELSVEETAEILNWKNEKVRLTFHRAIKALQKEKERFM
ncbi:RNA polymerase sigma factor [Pseudoneobacillus rhizosphaerae]|jgi:RNA polymerase sigma-70 factor, ECF subfamily|uniref:RNA polymerase sigma factor n=1 Tax=Pseudoneobacillus rhizosphaerae TaxID=2880968 RepID=A0A9C7G9Z2_9BACI|nr:RNA polymerase sigma factor [Pseudoneobacillus rhizosphaerae]CAG9608736.1 ECF RNA polymerase sigma factor SigX [Pseudoneobacillus rhizosphaerae]